MHSADSSSGGSVRELTASGHAGTTTKTIALDDFFAAEFGNRDFSQSRRWLPHYPSALGDGRP